MRGFRRVAWSRTHAFETPSRAATSSSVIKGIIGPIFSISATLYLFGTRCFMPKPNALRGKRGNVLPLPKQTGALLGFTAFIAYAGCCVPPFYRTPAPTAPFLPHVGQSVFLQHCQSAVDFLR